jgi:hypothetical protein
MMYEVTYILSFNRYLDTDYAEGRQKYGFFIESAYAVFQSIVAYGRKTLIAPIPPPLTNRGGRVSNRTPIVVHAGGRTRIGRPAQPPLSVIDRRIHPCR